MGQARRRRHDSAGGEAGSAGRAYPDRDRPWPGPGAAGYPAESLNRETTGGCSGHTLAAAGLARALSAEVHPSPGEEIMKQTLGYLRYVLSALATIGFALIDN